MYCSNCGAENQQDASFCCKCGAALKSKAVVAQKNNNEIGLDNNEINKIGQLAVELQQLDNVEKALQQRQKKQANLSQSINRNKRQLSNKSYLILTMGGISLGILFVLFFILTCTIAMILIFLHIDSMISLKIVFILSAIVTGVIVKKFYSRLKNMIEKRLLEETKKLEERQITIKAECEQIENDRQKLRKAISDKIGIIPPNYRYQMAVQYIYESFRNMRARNMTEAINLFEEQLHRWKMEASQQQMVELARQQTAAARMSAVANVVSASANIANASHTRDIANRLR